MLVPASTDDAVPDDDLVCPILWSLVFQDQVKEELFGVPVEKLTEIHLQTEIKLDQVREPIHKRILNALNSKKI